MNLKKSGLWAALFSFLIMAVSHAHSSSSPVGYWKTIDDVTGKPKSIVQIWRAPNHVLMGKIVKIFPKEGFASNRVCYACEGKLRNQPIVGMIILSGLKPSQAHWHHGRILDPENGKTYHCSIRLADNDKKLTVQGYMGLPMLGRSQIWERVDLMSDK